MSPHHIFIYKKVVWNGMYRAYEFTFAGMPASHYGMFVCDFGSKGKQAHSVNKLSRLIFPMDLDRPDC